MPDDPIPPTPPVDPEPKPKTKTKTSADDVTSEAERERKISALEEKFKKQEADNKTIREQIEALLPKPPATGTPPVGGPVVKFLREFGILH